jgi:hypothetical protein
MKPITEGIVISEAFLRTSALGIDEHSIVVERKNLAGAGIAPLGVGRHLTPMGVKVRKFKPCKF